MLGDDPKKDSNQQPIAGDAEKDKWVDKDAATLKPEDDESDEAVSRRSFVKHWQKKIKDARLARGVQDDMQHHLSRLCGKNFLRNTPWDALQHLPRYLKAAALRLDKLRSDPTRDETRMSELKPLEQRYLKRVAELKGASDDRLEEFRWLLEELRVSLFAQELRTPQPVSVKRLEKVWGQIGT